MSAAMNPNPQTVMRVRESDLHVTPTLHVCGVSHDRASLEVRERFALGPERCLQTLQRIRDEGLASEALVLSTCNRTEIYAFSGLGEAFSDVLENFFVSLSAKPIEGHTLPLYSYEGLEAARHFFAVGAGLDSMILGENEIKAQIRQAFEASCRLNMTGMNLHRLIEAANRAMKRVKTETDLNCGTLSVGRAAILQAAQTLGTIEGKTCVVIGAGKIGRLAAQAIAERNPARLLIVNRTVEKAREVAEGLNAQIISIPEMAPAIQQADLILGAAFAPNFLVTRAMFEAVRGKECRRPICLIDTAVPRILDHAIGEVAGVTLLDLSHMENVIAENRAKRTAAAQKAWEIVEEEVEKFRARVESFSVGPIVERLKHQFEAAFAETQAWIDPDLPDSVREKIRLAQHRLKQRLLHAAISELKGRRPDQI